VQDIQNIFEKLGGSFQQEPSVIRQKLVHAKAFLFDWDGVFNDGYKIGASGSPFSESDAMGTNLLRFSYWLRHGKLPVVGIITGEENPAARELALREHFDVIYFKSSRKAIAFDHFCGRFGVKPTETVYTFDDVLDIPVAQLAGLRMVISRSASPLFTRYLAEQQLADYISGNPGGQAAVREVTEIIIALQDNFSDVIQHRAAYSNKYQQYFAARQALATQVFRTVDGVVQAV
jgi:3-deoxy-D-manno-octulosonate 8-phosphate phosphatase (KDO 8-P phosphatase)